MLKVCVTNVMLAVRHRHVPLKRCGSDGFKERCVGAGKGGLAGTELLMCRCRREEKSFAETLAF